MAVLLSRREQMSKYVSETLDAFSSPRKRKKPKEKIQLHYLTQKTTVYANDSEDEFGESLCILCTSEEQE